MNTISTQDSVTISERTARLDELISTIRESDALVRRNLFVIVNCLRIIDSERLYAVKGYKSTASFAAKVLGYSPTATSRFLQVAQNFLLPDGTKSKFARGDEDFSINQLEELIPLKDDDVITEMVESGEITPDMKIKQIRETVRAKKQTLRRLPADNLERESQNSVETIAGVEQPEELNESTATSVSLNFTERTEAETLPDVISNPDVDTPDREDNSEQSPDETSERKEADSHLEFRVIELESEVEKLESEKYALEEKLREFWLKDEDMQKIIDEYKSLQTRVGAALLEGVFQGGIPQNNIRWAQLVDTIITQYSTHLGVVGKLK